ncbi:MAG: ABC transporter ATP-binding protein, partial [Phycisphaerae bacterium]
MRDAAAKAFTKLDEAHTRPLNLAILARMWQHLRARRWGIAINLVLAAAIVVMELVPPPLTRHIIDVDILKDRSPAGLARSLSLLAASILAIWVLWRSLIWRVTTLGERVIFQLREDIFAHLQRLSIGFFDKTKLGRIIARGTSDVQAMRATIVWGLPRLVQMALMLVGALAVMAWAEARLFAALALLLPPLLLANHLFRNRVSQAWRDVREWISRITANVAENISGIRVVQAYTREETNLAIFNDLQDHAVASRVRAAKIFGVYLPTLDLIGACGKAIILLYGGYLVAAGQTGIGTLVMFLMCYDMFFRPIRQLGEVYNDALHAMAGAERIYALLDTQPEIVDAPDAVDLPPIQGHVHFDHVTFGYQPDQPVLHDICFEVQPGQTVALVGPTGAGKTSIVNLVCRFYEPQHGTIRID